MFPFRYGPFLAPPSPPLKSVCVSCIVGEANRPPGSGFIEVSETRKRAQTMIMPRVACSLRGFPSDACEARRGEARRAKDLVTLGVALDAGPRGPCLPCLLVPRLVDNIH